MLSFNFNSLCTEYDVDHSDFLLRSYITFQCVSKITFELYYELYFIMNLLLAVVVNTFSENEREKLRRNSLQLWQMMISPTFSFRISNLIVFLPFRAGLLLHRREACRRAFKLLNSHSNPNHISVKHFAGMMRYFRRKSTKQVYLW